jgi:hypothetical protein
MTEREHEIAAVVAWQTAPAIGLETAIAEFKAKLPGWWFSLGECQVSADASCGPTRESPHIALIRHYVANAPRRRPWYLAAMALAIVCGAWSAPALGQAVPLWGSHGAVAEPSGCLIGEIPQINANSAKRDSYYRHSAHHAGPKRHGLLAIQIILIALIGATGLFYFTRAVLVGERHAAFGGYLILGIAGIVCGVAGGIIVMEPVLNASIGKDRYSEDYRGPQPPL